MSKEFLNVKRSFLALQQLERDLNNKKDKKNHTRVTENFKKNFDKLYFYAYYDSKLKIPNINKLSDDIKEFRETSKMRLIFLNITKLSNNFYIGGKEKIEAFINEIKENELFKKSLYPNIYYHSGYLILLANRNDVEKYYYTLKKIKCNYASGICYVKYSKLSSKDSKNLTMCFTKAAKIFSGEGENELD